MINSNYGRIKVDMH